MNEIEFEVLPGDHYSATGSGPFIHVMAKRPRLIGKQRSPRVKLSWWAPQNRFVRNHEAGDLAQRYPAEFKVLEERVAAAVATRGAAPMNRDRFG